MSIDLIFAIFATVFTLVAVAGLYDHLRQSRLDREVERDRRRYRFEPDLNGNYATFYNPATGIYMQPDPGNASNPPLQNYLIQPERSEIRVAIPRPEVAVSGYGITSERPSEATSQPQLLTSSEAIAGFLTECKQKGMSKTATLKLLGITGGTRYTTLGKLFDNIHIDALALRPEAREGE